MLPRRRELSRSLREIRRCLTEEQKIFLTGAAVDPPEVSLPGPRNAASIAPWNLLGDASAASV